MGSSPTVSLDRIAGIIQWLECYFAKVDVAGSSPAVRFVGSQCGETREHLAQHIAEFPLLGNKWEPIPHKRGCIPTGRGFRFRHENVRVRIPPTACRTEHLIWAVRLAAMALVLHTSIDRGFESLTAHLRIHGETAITTVS